MMRLRLFILPAVVVLAAGAIWPGAPRFVAAQQPSETTPRLVQATFDLLTSRAYRPIDPAAVLSEAWQQAVAALQAGGDRGPLPTAPQLSGSAAAAWQAFAAAWQAAPQLHTDDVEWQAIRGMVQAVPHGVAVLDEDVTELPGGRWSGTGIGIRLTERVPWVVLERAPDSAAERADLRPGDVLLAVEGRDVTALARPVLNDLLRLPAGASVTLTIDRPGAGRQDLAIEAARFAFPALDGAMLDGVTGSLRLRSLPPPVDGSAGEALDREWARLQAAGAQRLVLDLRDNVGGDGFALAEVVGRLLGDGQAYQLWDASGRRAARGTVSRPLTGRPPLIVLVNAGTAGAAEVLAATLQDAGRATVVGTPTAGLTPVFVSFPLGDRRSLRVAVAEMRSGPSGRAVDGAGVVPDVVVAGTLEPAALAQGRDPQREAAVALVTEPRSEPAEPAGAGPVAATALRSLLTPYLPPSTDLPSRIQARSTELLLTTADQWTAWLGPVADPGTLTGLARSRGWRGSVIHLHQGADGMAIEMRLDLYSSPAGAFTALRAGDAALLASATAVPAGAPEDATAVLGVWVAERSLSLSFRAGRLVATVSCTGRDPADCTAVTLQLAVAVNSRYQASPLPDAVS